MIDLERLEADRDSARVTFDAFDAIEEYKPALTAIAAYIAGLASLDAALAAQEQEKNND